jgi:hypothetical protein|tara:strand:- start:8 stop:304 length:297 start_codon:yes stop_codon:yes gene_type:complete
MNEKYCKISSDEVVERIGRFMTDTSRLPSVSVSEIAYRPEFDDLFEDFVGERRRWMELGKMLAEHGWQHKRMRSLFFQGEGDYVNKVTARWFPPAKEG